MKSIEQVIAEHAPALLEKDGVVGVYEGVDPNDVGVIRVAVVKHTRKIVGRIPKEIDGYRIEIVETGPIGPL
jgi:hypothetical protein